MISQIHLFRYNDYKPENNNSKYLMSSQLKTNQELFKITYIPIINPFNMHPSLYNLQWKPNI